MSVIFGDTTISDIIDIPGDLNNLYNYGGGSSIVNLDLGDDILVIFDQSVNFNVVNILGITHVYGSTTATTTFRNTETILVNIETLKFNDGAFFLSPPPAGFDNIIIGFNEDADGNGLSDSTDDDDLIDHTGGTGSIEGGLGTDAILFFDSSENYIVTTSAGFTQVYGKNTATTPYANEQVILYSVEQIHFTDRTIVIQSEGSQPTQAPQFIFDADPADFVLLGTSGDDVIDPMGGSDLIVGGEGDDTVLIFDNLNNFTFWTLLSDTWMWGENNSAAEPYKEFISILHGVEQVQFLDGTVSLEPADDLIIYGTNSETEEVINGTSGDDIIDHLGGPDRIYAGEGEDTVLFFGTMDEFTVSSLAGEFRVLGKELGSNIDFPYENDEVVLYNVERLLFIDGEITLDGYQPPTDANVTGTTSTDSEYIVGTQGDNVIDHLGGSDRIDGGGGSDTLLLFDTMGNFTVTTLAGVTHLLGKPGAATVYANQELVLQSVESLRFADGTVPLDTTPANVELGLNSGSATAETIIGTRGDDIIDHLGGSDTIEGGGGFDSVLFFDSRHYYSITVLGDRARVVGTDGAAAPYRNVEAVLDDIELLQFLDGTVLLGDDSPGGSNNDDRFSATNNSDVFDGGAGIDTVVYGGARSGYLISQAVSGYMVGRGALDLDRLFNVERLQFADRNVAIDLFEGNAAASTVMMLGATYGPASINDRALVGVGLYLFDGGWSMKQVADLIVGLDNFRQLSDRAFIQTLCNNVGFAATANELNALEQILDVGVERSALLEAFAEHAINAEHIDLLGLQRTGIEYFEYGA